jgi:hypothetical protein
MLKSLSGSVIMNFPAGNALVVAFLLFWHVATLSLADGKLYIPGGPKLHLRTGGSQKFCICFISFFSGVGGGEGEGEGFLI